MLKHWGYERLQHHYTDLSKEEIGHSSGLIDPILYLTGTPDVQHLDRIARGRDVATLLSADLDFERQDLELLQKAIRHCAQVGDFTTRHMLEHMITDTDEHIDWFETELRTIEQVGLERHLSEQIKK